MQACRRRCARATGRSPSRSIDGDQITAVWPGFHDAAYGLAVDVGSTTIAGHLCDLVDRRGGRLVRHDEPADPLRRGPDEPGLLRDDEPRRRRGDDRGRARGDQRAGRAASRPRPGSTIERHPRGRPSSATRSCITCCSASIRSSSAARPSRWRPTDRSRSGPASSTSSVHPNARVYVLPCIAGHVGADTAGVHPVRSAAQVRAR